MDNLNSDVKLYVITHTPYSFIDSEVIIPIATTKVLGDQINIINSEEGINKASLNPVIAEFSTFYWAQQNDTTSRYIGFNHYRRYLIPNETKVSYDPNIDSPASLGWDRDFIINTFNDYDIVLPYKLEFGVSVYQQYCFCHEQPIIDSFINLINTKYPEYAESFNAAFNATSGYFCNLFIMRREDFNEYVDFVFKIFNDMKIPLATAVQYKPFAYLGERIFCGYVEYLKRVRSFRVKEVPTLFLNGPI